MMSISKREIDEAQKPWIWDLGNRILYDLCRAYPGHADENAIVAKVWLIGRSYAASIERRRNVRGIGDDFYENTVAPAIKKSEIDSWLSSIPKTERPGSQKSVKVHKKLLDLFQSITGLEKRSLASKYLHFHRPDVFFIYDSRARQAITKIVPSLRLIPNMEVEECDIEYRNFVRRCVWLYHNILNSFNVALMPREIDKLLLTIANAEKRTHNNSNKGEEHG